MISQSPELVFVPAPFRGHLVSTVELAKLLVARDSRLLITVLIIKFPLDPSSNHELFLSSSVNSTSERIKFVDLPEIQIDSADLNPTAFFSTFFEDQKPLVRDAVSKLVESKMGRLAGFVLDGFCHAMADVADEFGVPPYLFFTSGSGFLSLMSHVLTLNDEHGIDTTDFKDEPGRKLLVPGLVKPFPAKLLPRFLFDKATAPLLLNEYRKIREFKGVLVNSFIELESNVNLTLSHSNYPPVYPVGPILNLNPGGGMDKKTEILAWLDQQPPSSVVFLCFGSMGCFGGEQVKEIAMALEQSGTRFLWSLRKPGQKGKAIFPTDYTDANEVLPEGFLDRTAEIGKVIGWAPQVSVLAHPAVGGFVSHCGWNSILESLWFSLPLATWPIFGDQQFNAFQMVRELGLAVEIRMDYRPDENAGAVRAEEIERGIRSVMEPESDTRKRVREFSQKSRKGVLDGGSSYSSLGRFISDVIDGTP